jgi:hypothetical protein
MPEMVGMIIESNTPITAITASISMSVKARLLLRERCARVVFEVVRMSIL